MTAHVLAASTAARSASGAAASLVVAEVFGPTIQGEGLSMGRRAAFIRLGGCNLHCTWCDTPYTWDATRHDLRAELTRRPVRDILAQIRGYAVPLLILTGGEPLLHQAQPGWRALLDGLTGVDVEVETNGTIRPTADTIQRVTRFNVSPKLAHAGDPPARRIVPAVLREYAGLAARGRAAFKFVCQTPEDLPAVEELVDASGIPRSAVWVMPEGQTVDAVLAVARIIADPAIAAGFNITSRLHILLWGNERAR